MQLHGVPQEMLAWAPRDLFEYLMSRHREGTLATDFTGRGPGRVSYQIPCHLRAQNIGFKTSDVLRLIPGTKVRVIERCTAMDGTWAMKKENYGLSLEFARRAASEMEADQPDTFTTDCSLSALQIEAVRGKKPAHPISLVREAYGLPEER
jgi:Fe-S oxidoreductase